MAIPQPKTPPTGKAAITLTLLKRLDETQWWPTERLGRLQLKLLGRLIEHAAATVPFYAARLKEAGIEPGRPLDWQSFRRIPVLTRRQLQQAGEALRSRSLPPEHGRTGEVKSSGSTGMPVKSLTTTRHALFYRAVMLRNHLWYGRDFRLKLAAIRKFPDGADAYPKGGRSSVWGNAAAYPFPTGPSVRLNITASIAQQAEWLAREAPDYLLSYPSNLAALADYCRERAIALPRLRQVSSMAELLTPETREACRAAWGVELTDVYSAEETGHIAVQCPTHEHYHVPAETICVEVLDEAGRPCRPGEVGKVTVTPLRQFAMPLIRYEIGDYAEAGGPCSCGRGLPVLNRIMGRVRNTLILPNGERHWPHFGSRGLAELAPVIQHQFVQVAPERIEARLVTERPLTPEEEARLRKHILAKLPSPFRLDFVYRDSIPRSPGGKFEDFISEVAVGAPHGPPASTSSA